MTVLPYWTFVPRWYAPCLIDLNSGALTVLCVSKSPGLSGRLPAVALRQSGLGDGADELELRYRLLILCSTGNRARVWLWCLRVGELGTVLGVYGRYLEPQHSAELDPTPSVLDY
ncbi:hypothetical protein SKAU_G00269500 [Synaphobranchus kaupii]|uniref:Uncharacterized protein n=1 Tax=Synaphobranchus kaupii TaxID=118154 RepID=A0A9Q1IQF8_SYNKA|nr:hypothetical protein SKAU_G00269500 [Synaphobranchus kaupii]